MHDKKLKLMCVLAHPDDESLGVGGTLATYAAEGIETFLLTATRGERGRFGDGSRRPSPEEVGRARENELRAAAAVLGISELHFLDYLDGELDRVDPRHASDRIASQIRRLKPDVVVTFAPDGAYGHPDHIAISQFTTAAIVKAAVSDDGASNRVPGHAVSKLYYISWTKPKWDVYQAALKKLVSRVDGQERVAVPWPQWAVTTQIDTARVWPTVWKAVACHKSQMASYENLHNLSPEYHKALWGTQEFYRAFSLVNGGRNLETDLFEGLRPEGASAEPIETVQSTAPESTGARHLGANRGRVSPLEIAPSEFRRLGHTLADQIGNFLEGLANRKVTRAQTVGAVRQIISAPRPLPDAGTEPADLLEWIVPRLFDHSLHNGHPRFFGYITSSAAPIGMLGDFLASAVNANVGAWKLSPLATEIETETIRWIAQLLGYPDECGGLLVSGGNMANFVGFLAAMRAKAGWDLRKRGVPGGEARLIVYASEETHTWIQKAADLFGLGTESIRWVAVDSRRRLRCDDLRRQIREDLATRQQPFLVVGTAGSVSTGAVDPLEELAEVCREHGLWFHVDGAYGGFAAAVPEWSHLFRGVEKADSVAVDPHKWLYAPLEAGCVLVRDRSKLPATFSFHPPYYHFDQEATNYFDQGMQNSRGFRALKVWLSLLQAGRQGYVGMISDDIRLAEELHRLVGRHDNLEAVTRELSIATFRFVPEDLFPRRESAEVAEYLNRLNQELLTRVEESGEAFLSNAVVDGKFLLRACIVNFRTASADIEALPEIVARIGVELDRLRRPAALPLASAPPTENPALQG